MSKERIACEMFAGAGGLSEGLGQAGFKVAVANEINRHAALTYSFNHPDTHLIQKDIRDVKAPEILDFVEGRIHLVAGGPPCQGVSSAGRRDIDDPRNSLFKEFIRIVGELNPKFFLMENVVGLLSMNNGKLFGSINKSFENIGYCVSHTVLNAADFGVPQNRRRVFIFGSPSRKHDIRSLVADKTDPVTVWDAISDLDFLKAGEASSKYVEGPKTLYQQKMREKETNLCNHEAPKHNEQTVKRFLAIKQGQSVKNLPPSLMIKKRTMFRLNAFELARTVTTLPDDYIHYGQDRILTVREMARLQSFDDSYPFLGPKSTGGIERRKSCPQYTQVGNAVPPLLAGGVGSWMFSL